MVRSQVKAAVIFSVLIFILFSCDRKPSPIPVDALQLEEIARSEHLWTGIAVSGEGRIFTNFPRWFPSIPMSVAEIGEKGEVSPYPDAEWNNWNPEKPPGKHFICVQSVYVDMENDLWILDPALSIYHGEVVPGGAKLVKVDLSTDQVIQTVVFDSMIAPSTGYLNDVRVDTKRNYAYITDSGLGAIIVVDLSTGKSRRVLEEDVSVKAENVVLTIEGEAWLEAHGNPPQVHSDGIALTRDGAYLYYQALTGRTLYRIRTKYLRDSTISEQELGEKVELVGKTGAADGITIGPDDCLYLTSLEYNAIRRRLPNGEIQTVFRDERLKWPDSIAIPKTGEIYFTVSQLHLISRRTDPFMIFRLNTVR